MQDLLHLKIYVAVVLSVFLFTETIAKALPLSSNKPDALPSRYISKPPLPSYKQNILSLLTNKLSSYGIVHKHKSTSINKPIQFLPVNKNDFFSSSAYKPPKPMHKHLTSPIYQKHEPTFGKVSHFRPKNLCWLHISCLFQLFGGYERRKDSLHL